MTCHRAVPHCCELDHAPRGRGRCPLSLQLETLIVDSRTHGVCSPNVSRLCDTSFSIAVPDWERCVFVWVFYSVISAHDGDQSWLRRGMLTAADRPKDWPPLLVFHPLFFHTLRYTLPYTLPHCHSQVETPLPCMVSLPFILVVRPAD